MKNQNVVRALFLMGVALLFGVGSFNYNLGSFSRAGPGLFPLMVSCLLFMLGVFMMIRAFMVEPEPMTGKFRNLFIILGALIGFALLSHFLNMTLGIIFLVFFATLTEETYSVKRNVQITAGLLVIAFMFQKLLGLNLPLY